MKQVVICLLIFTGFLPRFCAQNIGEDLIKLNDAYAKIENISMQIKYSVFFDGKQESNETEVGIIKKSKNKVYTNEFSSESLVNDEYQIIVDHSNKVLIVDYVDKTKSTSSLDKLNVDSLLKGFELVEFKGITESNLKLYHLSYKYGDVSFVELWLDVKTGFLSKINIHYRGKMEVAEGKFSKVMASVEYNKIQSNITFSQYTFSEKQYVSITKKEVELASKYKEYQLINHLN